MQKKIEELILKLTLSGLPPSLQEFIINGIGNVSEVSLEKMINILDDLNERERGNVAAGEKYKEFLSRLSDDMVKELHLESEKIQQELLQELIK